MSRLAFIGLGNMGVGMAANQVKAGHQVAAFDLSAAALDRSPSQPKCPRASMKPGVITALLPASITRE